MIYRPVQFALSHVETFNAGLTIKSGQPVMITDETTRTVGLSYGSGFVGIAVSDSVINQPISVLMWGVIEAPFDTSEISSGAVLCTPEASDDAGEYEDTKGTSNRYIGRLFKYRTNNGIKSWVIVTPQRGVDNGLPVISLVGDNPQILTVDDTYEELGATAFDTVDGDITTDIVIDATDVNTTAAGDYTVTYNVTDSNGNDAIEVTRTVTVNE